MLGLHDVLTVRHGPVYFGFLQIYDLRWTINGLGQAWTLCVEASWYLLERHAIAFGQAFSRRNGVGAAAPAEDRAGAP